MSLNNATPPCHQLTVNTVTSINISNLNYYSSGAQHNAHASFQCNSSTATELNHRTSTFSMRQLAVRECGSKVFLFIFLLLQDGANLLHIREDVRTYMQCVCATLDAVQVTCAWVCESFELLLLWFFGLRTVYLLGLVSASSEIAIRVEFCGCHTVLHMQIQ